MMFMTRNPLRERWAAGEAAIGVTVAMASPELVEICGLLQFDFVLIDHEHGALNRGDCVAMVRAAQVSGITPLVRVLKNDPAEILQALDAGAAGVMVPGVQTAEDARQAVRAARFAPEGDRGLAGTRAAGYGLAGPLTAHMASANREVVVVPLVESVTGMENLAAIARVPGVDAIFLGPADLSQSMGHPGQVTHPDVQRALEQGLATIVASGKVAGISAATGAIARHWQHVHGARMIAPALSALLAAGGREFLAEVRQERNQIQEGKA